MKFADLGLGLNYINSGDRKGSPPRRVVPYRRYLIILTFRLLNTLSVREAAQPRAPGGAGDLGMLRLSFASLTAHHPQPSNKWGDLAICHEDDFFGPLRA